MDHPLRFVPVNAHQGEDRDMMSGDGANKQVFQLNKKPSLSVMVLTIIRTAKIDRFEERLRANGSRWSLRNPPTTKDS